MEGASAIAKASACALRALPDKPARHGPPLCTPSARSDDRLSAGAARAPAFLIIPNIPVLCNTKSSTVDAQKVHNQAEAGKIPVCHLPPETVTTGITAAADYRNFTRPLFQLPENITCTESSGAHQGDLLLRYCLLLTVFAFPVASKSHLPRAIRATARGSLFADGFIGEIPLVNCLRRANRQARAAPPAHAGVD